MIIVILVNQVRKSAGPELVTETPCSKLKWGRIFGRLPSRSEPQRASDIWARTEVALTQQGVSVFWPSLF